MSLCGNNSAPALRERQIISPTPHGQRTLLERVTIVNLFAVKQLQADILMSSRGMTQQQYVALSALLTEPSGRHTPILKRECVAVKVVSSQLFCRSESCCHVAVFLIKTPRLNRIKHFYGEPRCYHAATSERRRIQSRADNNIIALRGVGDRATEKVSI